MTTLIVPIRSDRAYIGFGKQSAGGTPVAPSLFPRWLDGTALMLDIKAEDVWEGDGSRRLGSIIKNLSEVKVKAVIYPRPNEAGFFETMAMGVGSDAFTAPTVATTLSAATLVNATSVTVAANTGLTGTGTIALDLEPGVATEETPSFNLPATGTGPYTLTVASTYNNGKLAKAHANSGAVKSAASHVITDQTDGNYYSVEISIGDTAGIIVRVRDCKLESIKRSAKAGGILTYEVDLQGIASVVQTAAATTTYDTHPYFLFDSGVWTLDGNSTGYALQVDSFDISQKNNLDTSIQTEGLTLAALIFGNLQLDVGIGVIFTDGSYIGNVYFGGSVASNATEAQTVYQGSLNLVFALGDSFNQITYNVPTLNYTKADVPQPKKDGKAFRQALSASATSNFGQNAFLMQVTVANSTYAQY